MDIVGLIISLVSGAAGGNIAGAAMKDKSLGTLGNSIAGILGGGVGGAILQFLGLVASGQGGIDIGSVVSNVAGGGVGGALLLAVVSLIKQSMAPKH